MDIISLNRSNQQRLRQIQPRHLNCFLETARLKKISAAAITLNISQPAASKTLAELERILETRLFDRGGRGGLTLTASGNVFLRFAGASIAALKEGLDGIALAQMHAAPALMIGVLPGVAARFMPTAVQKFRESHSTLIRIITGANIEMLDQLRTGELDLVVGRLGQPQAMQGLSFSYLYSEKMLFVVRPGHPHAGDEPFNLALLEQMTLLMPVADGVMRRTIDRFMIGNGVGAIRMAIEARSPDFCRQYVLDSDAVWMISRGVVESDIKNGIFKVLKVDTGDTQGPVGLTTRADTHPRPSLRMMMDMVEQVACSHPVS